MRHVLMALALILTALPAAQAQECKRDVIASLDLHFGDSGVPLVSVVINGRPLQFIVDTAAVFPGIDPAVAERLGLKPRSIGGLELYSFEGQRITRYVTAKSVQVGVQVGVDRPKDTEMVLMPKGSLPDGVDGVLAPTFLMNFDLDFDFAAGKLNLIRPQQCRTRGAYWTRHYVKVPFRLSSSLHITLPAVLDGQAVNIALDTGASASVLNRNVARRRFGLTERSPGAELAGMLHARTKIFRYQFQSMSFNRVLVLGPLVYVHPDSPEQAFDRIHAGDPLEFDPLARDHLDTQDMIVGMDILAELHLYVAYNERVLYVSRADAS